MRAPTSLAYLLARAADSISDTSLIPCHERQGLLSSLRAAIGTASHARLPPLDQLSPAGEHESERRLLAALPELLAVLQNANPADRASISKVLDILITGMEADLAAFPDKNSGCIGTLPDEEALDRYTYLVAGCVGEFWTETMCRHAEAMHGADRNRLIKLGVQFGKALQMVNILRDCPRDLRIGRCYLPQTLLGNAGFAAGDLLQADRSARVQPVIRTMTEKALDDFRAAVEYVMLIPPHCRRLRLACIWPLAIGLETLLAHSTNPHRLDPDRITKIPRSRVYCILLLSMTRVASDQAVRKWMNRYFMEIETALTQPFGTDDCRQDAGGLA
ncbi:MAG: farnesyl-diphosphate farnesyltransferase [Paucimonas sp.]|nr:farnesyl-diphosphate farnesyltransferase [Paucimonas sp.]